MSHFRDRLRLGEDVRVDADVAAHRPGTKEHRRALIHAMSRERLARHWGNVFDYTPDQYRELIGPPERVDDLGVVGALAEVERPPVVEEWPDCGWVDVVFPGFGWQVVAWDDPWPATVDDD